jgi:hypothetical protein
MQIHAVHVNTGLPFDAGLRSRRSCHQLAVDYLFVALEATLMLLHMFLIHLPLSLSFVGHKHRASEWLDHGCS